MREWLKKYFIPHDGNQHNPHILRTEVMIFFVTIIALSELTFLITAFVVLPNSNFFSLILPSELVRGANQSRQTSSIGELQVNPLLEKAAQLKAQDMAQKSYFAHTSPEGVTPWYWLGQVGYRYAAAGENLAVNFLDSSDVHTAWMASPGHRANILNGTYTQIGIGTATGMYKGYQTTFVVEYFGKPKQAIIPVSRVTAAEPTVLAAEISVPPSPVPSIEPAKTPAPIPAASTFVSAPRRTSNALLTIIGVIIAISLGITMIVKFEFPHPQLVIKPMLVILVIISLMAINNYISIARAAIF